MKEMSHRFVFVGLFLCAIATSTYAQAAPDAILCWSSRILGSRPRIIVDLRLKSDSGNRQCSGRKPDALMSRIQSQTWRDTTFECKSSTLAR